MACPSQRHSGSPELLYTNKSSGNSVYIVLVVFVGAVSQAGVREEMVILKKNSDLKTKLWICYLNIKRIATGYYSSENNIFFFCAQIMNISIIKKSQHGCIRWVLREHLSPPCSDFACGGLENCQQ